MARGVNRLASDVIAACTPSNAASGMTKLSQLAPFPTSATPHAARRRPSHDTGDVAPTARLEPRRSGRWLYVGLAVAALASVLVGFVPSIANRMATPPSGLTPHVLVHGVLFSSWIVLFLVQTLLVATDRARLHRRLGLASTALVTAMVVTAPATAIGLARRDLPPPDPLGFMLIILIDLLMFAGFFAAAVYSRRRSEVHKRLMVLAMVNLMPPAITRWPGVNGRPAILIAATLLFLLAVPVYDLLSRRRPHPVSVWGGLILLTSFPIRLALARTAAWHYIASWLIR